MEGESLLSFSLVTLDIGWEQGFDSVDFFQCFSVYILRNGRRVHWQAVASEPLNMLP